MTVLLALVTAVLFACGSWLLMQRRLTRIIVGIGLLGHGANMLLITSGPSGRPPIIDGGGGYADPLPQALALTAIVITFGVTAFLLALGFRSWQLTRDDRVEDDVEDRIIARRQPDRAEDEAITDPEDTFGPDEEVDGDDDAGRDRETDDGHAGRRTT
jgi:multicomponent Na+:H+ antiporter subunit C